MTDLSSSAPRNNGSGTTAASRQPGSVARWLLGARPKTWPASIVPVAVGIGLAVDEGEFAWWKAVLALFVAFSFQVGVNYANDYSDGKRGTDENRVGPQRMVSSKLASPESVRRAAILALTAGAIAGVLLSILVGEPWLLLVGATAVPAAWFYTGGRRPYGYIGLGELAVFAFFGPVAVLGTSYVMTKEITFVGVLASASVGALAVALLEINNLRDVVSDTRAGKRTLAVRLGEVNARRIFIGAVWLPFVLTLVALRHQPGVFLAVLSFPLARRATRPVHRGAVGPELVAVFGQVARLELAFGILLAIGLAF